MLKWVRGFYWYKSLAEIRIRKYFNVAVILTDISIPRVPIQNVNSDTTRRHSKDATEEESIKELTSKLEEVASQHAEKVIKSRPASGKRSSDDSIESELANLDSNGNCLYINYRQINDMIDKL